MPGRTALCWLSDVSDAGDVSGFFRLALLTAQRPGEVKGMAWDEVDLSGGLWTIPAERSKNGKAHRVPLSPPCVALLRDLREHASESP